MMRTRTVTKNGWLFLHPNGLFTGVDKEIFQLLYGEPNRNNIPKIGTADFGFFEGRTVHLSFYIAAEHCRHLENEMRINHEHSNRF